MKLEIQNLRVELQKQLILPNLSLTVEDGEFLSLLGPSGCGKSTLLKTVAGILPMAGGKMTLDGADLTVLPAHRRGAVIVFQDLRLFPHMNAAENVAFPLKMQGVGRDERLRTAKVLLETVQLADCWGKRVSRLSGGQQQRIALARALAARPKLLLLDEPFSSLDENLRQEMRTLVLRLHREFHMTTILVTHDRAEALSMADRVALLFDGQILQCGTPKEVYNRPASKRVADYFGNCAYLPGLVSGGMFTGSHLRFPTAEPDGVYELMLRAGAILSEQSGDFPLTIMALQFRGADSIAVLQTPEGAIWKKSFTAPPAHEIGVSFSCAVDTNQGVLFPAGT